MNSMKRVGECKMVVGKHRATSAIVDCQKMFHNIRNEMMRMPENCELFAVVKASGYGHGAIESAKVAQKAGVHGFCVAILDEAIELREAGFKEPILILGIVDPEYIHYVVQYHLSITVASNEWLNQAATYYPKESFEQKIPLHIKIDTGMNRIGYKELSDIEEFLFLMKEYPQFELEGIYTHFSKGDTRDKEYFHFQQEKFKEALTILPKQVRYIHTANTATAFWHESWCSNMIRLGIGMYGLNPSGKEQTPPYPLEAVMSLETKINQVKKIKKGERVGYGAEYQALSDEWVGTIPIGYADGFRRDFKGYSLIVDGHYAPIIGRICMDQCMIRLPYEVPVGTIATIIGENKGLENTMQDAADYIGTINYEIPCALTARIPRKYINEI